MRLFLKQDIFILYAIEKLQRNSKKIIRHFFQACLCTYTKVTYLHVVSVRINEICVSYLTLRRLINLLMKLLYTIS